MPDAVLPEGRYLSCALRVSLDAGGQTRALLLRNRNLVRAGVRPDVLVLGAAPDHERRRQELLERGLLVEGIGMLNIYDHYRAHGWGDLEPIDVELADLAAHRVREDEDAGGAPWRITYRVPGERYATYDYLRPDGTPYLRIPAFGLAGGSRGRGQVLQIDPRTARSCASTRRPGQWFRRWIRELAEGQERTFVFVDSRYVVPHVVPIRARAVHLIYVMHNLTCSSRTAGTPRSTSPTGACWPRSTAWTRWSRSPSASATTSPSGAGGRATCTSSRTRSTCRRSPRTRRPRDPHRVDDHGAARAAEAAAGRDRRVRARGARGAGARGWTSSATAAGASSCRRRSTAGSSARTSRCAGSIPRRATRCGRRARSCCRARSRAIRCRRSRA